MDGTEPSAATTPAVFRNARRCMGNLLPRGARSGYTCVPRGVKRASTTAAATHGPLLRGSSMIADGSAAVLIVAPRSDAAPRTVQAAGAAVRGRARRQLVAAEDRAVSGPHAP